MDTKSKVLFLLITIGFLSFWPFRALPQEPQPMRIVSLAPSTTEILFALGLEQEIVGVSSFCDYPRKAETKEKVGTFSQPNIEKIVALKPDIIFCTGLEQAPLIHELRQLKLNVNVSDPKSIAELYDSIREIGMLTHREPQANALIAQMRHKIDLIVAKTTSIPQEKKQSVFIEIWNDPLMTAGKDSFINDLVRLAGGINIADNTRRAYGQFSNEGVIKRNPDCIIATYMGTGTPLDAFKKRFGWRNLSAVRNRRIYIDINPDLLFRPGPRAAKGLRELYERFYP